MLRNTPSFHSRVEIHGFCLPTFLEGGKDDEHHPTDCPLISRSYWYHYRRPGFSCNGSFQKCGCQSDHTFPSEFGFACPWTIVPTLSYSSSSILLSFSKTADDHPSQSFDVLWNCVCWRSTRTLLILDTLLSVSKAFKPLIHTLFIHWFNTAHLHLKDGRKSETKDVGATD